MRLKLTLQCPPNSRLAFDHHYALQAVIYRTLENADPVFSYWLHDKGYQTTGEKRFKLFTFDLLRGQPYRRDKDRNQIVFPTGVVEWQVSFCVDLQVETFIAGLFKNQTFDVVADQTKAVFQVRTIEALQEPDFSPTMRFSVETGICVTEKTETDRYAQFRHPDDANYKTLFFNNMAAKYRAATGSDANPIMPDYLDLKTLSEPKKWSTIAPQGIGNRVIKTLGYAFDFEVTAPTEWLKVNFAAGFGEKNSGGFGYCRELK